MIRRVAVLVSIAALLAFALPARAQDDPGEKEPGTPVEEPCGPGGAPGAGEAVETGDLLQQLEKLGFQPERGPGTGQLGSLATIHVPEGFGFFPPAQARKFLELNGNPTSGNEQGVIQPAAAGWFCTFDFSDVGYVKDDEKASLDADAILEAIRAGTEQSNVARRARGWSPLKVVGWHTPPRYNEQSHHVEWATLLESEGRRVVNYDVRLLGRTGVMEAKLVADPQEITAVLPEFRALIATHAFVSGKGYGEYRKGDRVAEYGLTALVAGGALAVAAKSGILAKLWKPIAVGFIALVAAIKRLFGGGRSAPKAPQRPSSPPPA